ncbi:MAG: Ig-like domain-containing protein, partial [Planctomycetes bacterium]|nr:Ig-like domain-containing protein [Planctomycetota bacterium]
MMWISSNTDIATVSPSGMLSGIVEGSVMISATYVVDGSFSAQVTAMVTKEVSTLDISPDSLNIADNATSQLSVQATFSDNSMADYTMSAVWTVSPSSLGTVSASGLFTAVNPGSGTIRATDQSTGVFDEIQVTVTPILVSIAVTPANATINHNSTQQYTATGTYSDNSMVVMSNNEIMWTTNNVNVLAISPSGQGTAAAPGTVTVQATWLTNGSIFGTTQATVVAVLTSVTISPTQATINHNATQQFTLTANFSDSSQQNVTSPATWNSSNTSAATVNSTGLASGVAAGSTVITGTYMGMSAQAQLTVQTAPVSFSGDVMPIFQSRGCLSHHQGAVPDGGLNLTSFANLMAGGNNGAGEIVKAGNGNDSLI